MQQLKVNFCSENTWQLHVWLFILWLWFLQGHGDHLGVVTKKRKMAKHKLPWSKIEETEKEYQPLQWKRNQFAAMRWKEKEIGYHIFEGRDFW